LSTDTDPPGRDRWARLRFAIVGPLLAAPPAPGQLKAALWALAVKGWRHPITGFEVAFGASTIERWYYAARRASDPVEVLGNRLRTDIGRFPSMSARAVAVLSAQYRQHPGWTMQLHFDNLRVGLAGGSLAGGSRAGDHSRADGEAAETMPSYASVRRFLNARGMVRQASLKSANQRATEGALRARDRLERLEVRSFEVDHVSALWHLDFHHGSRKVLTRAGAWIKPMLLGVIDDRSRLVCHLQWYLDESAQSLIHGLSQAFMKRGLPRALMTDNGAAMLAAETVTGLARLGIVHQTTLPYSPYQNAKQESFWARIETRLMAMLEGEVSLSLELLNEATQAWVEQEYHRSVHSEIGATPLAHYLAGPDVRRPCPEQAVLIDAFRLEVARRQRRSDGTLSLAGARFEVPARYRHLAVIHLRYARWDLSRIDLIDARSGTVLCPLRPLDKSENASGQRRALSPTGIDRAVRPPSGIAPLLLQLLAEHAATGLPPAYLPTDLPAELPTDVPLDVPTHLPTDLPTNPPPMHKDPE
jgi:putative transposase